MSESSDSDKGRPQYQNRDVDKVNGLDLKVSGPDLKLFGRDLEVNGPDLKVNGPGLKVNGPEDGLAGRPCTFNKI